MGSLHDPVTERTRAAYVLVFTACFSRQCFVWVSFSQTTEAVIARCEAAWTFFGGVFATVIPDNMSAVDKANPTEPRLNQAFVERLWAFMSHPPGTSDAVARWDPNHRDDAGSVLQVHGWDVAAERLVRIGTGDAERLRPLCTTAQLICPYPGCPDPAFTTVREYTNRFGTTVPAVFRHRNTATAGHDPESWFHLTAKLLVAEWLRQAAGGWLVEVERTVDTGPKRRPDVSARRSSDGSAIAIEVQYSPLDPEEWRSRTADLEAAGFTPIWLWGHRGAHARLLSEGLLRIGALVQLAWHDGFRPHWIDPELDMIMSIAPGSTGHQWLAECDVAEDPLCDAAVVAGRIVTPTDIATEAEEKRLAAEREAELKREKLRRVRAEAAAEAERARLERLANESDAERRRREEYRIRRRVEDAERWKRSPLRKRLL